MNIGEAARASGVSSKMIRHYEAIGLLAPSLRSESGYRIYGEKDLHNLRFIATARSLGFSLDEIQQLLSLWQDKSRSSADVKAVITKHVETLDQKMAEMSEIKRILQDLASKCRGNSRPDCPILEGLSGNFEVSARD